MLRYFQTNNLLRLAYEFLSFMASEKHGKLGPVLEKREYSVANNFGRVIRSLRKKRKALGMSIGERSETLYSPSARQHTDTARTQLPICLNTGTLRGATDQRQVERYLAGNRFGKAQGRSVREGNSENILKLSLICNLVVWGALETSANMNHFVHCLRQHANIIVDLV